MRRLLLLAISLLGCATEGGPVAGVSRDASVEDTSIFDASPPAGTVRVASFNVRRFFDDVCDSGACGRDDFEALATPAAIAARTAELSERLSTLRATVITLAEIEKQTLLDVVAARMPGYVTHVLGETGAAASVDVGVLSTYPTVAVKRHRDRVLTRPDGSTTTFARELLEVHLDAAGARVIVFAAHFRSKSNDDPGRRYAEAEAAREIVSTAARDNPGALVVLGGDLNDVPGSPPLTALEAGGLLLRASAGLPDEVIATYWFEGKGAALDHLYVTAEGRFVAGSFHVARDPGARTFAGSDHAAVYADFR